MDRITVKIVTPQKVLKDIHCDSVHIMVYDDKNGKGGGSYGIRAGQINTVYAICKGPIYAYHEGKVIFSCETIGGFATFEDNVLTVTTEEFIENK